MGRFNIPGIKQTFSALVKSSRGIVGIQNLNGCNVVVSLGKELYFSSLPVCAARRIALGEGEGVHVQVENPFPHVFLAWNSFAELF